MTRRVWIKAGAIAVGLTGAAAMLLSQNGSPSPVPSAPPMTLADVPQDDAILRAMHDEMDRSRQLRIAGAGEVPYFFSYSATDGDNLTISASLGAVYSVSRNRFRAPAIEVRAGTYDFDHTGHIY